jgi:hypothetical protein
MFRLQHLQRRAVLHNFPEVNRSEQKAASAYPRPAKNREGGETVMARTSYADYRRRALKAWRTKRANAKRAEYQRRARKAWRTKRAAA